MFKKKPKTDEGIINIQESKEEFFLVRTCRYSMHAYPTELARELEKIFKTEDALMDALRASPKYQEIQKASLKAEIEKTLTEASSTVNKLTAKLAEVSP